MIDSVQIIYHKSLNLFCIDLSILRYVYVAIVFQEIKKIRSFIAFYLTSRT